MTVSDNRLENMAALIMPHAVHQIKGLTLLALRTVYSVNVQPRVCVCVCALCLLWSVGSMHRDAAGCCRVHAEYNKQHRSLILRIFSNFAASRNPEQNWFLLKEGLHILRIKLTIDNFNVISIHTRPVRPMLQYTLHACSWHCDITLHETCFKEELKYLRILLRSIHKVLHSFKWIDLIH